MTAVDSQIPWGHNILLIQKLDNPTGALYYAQKTIENNWSRSVLTHQIESGLHLREGKAIDNFDVTLPIPESDLARQLLRDPYNFDFLTLTKRHGRDFCSSLDLWPVLACSNYSRLDSCTMVGRHSQQHLRHGQVILGEKSSAGQILFERI